MALEHKILSKRRYPNTYLMNITKTKRQNSLKLVKAYKCIFQLYNVINDGNNFIVSSQMDLFATGISADVGNVYV